MIPNVKTIALSLLLALALAGAAQAETTIIRFSHVVAEDTPKGMMALQFKRLVEQRLYGKFAVQVYPNSTLFDDDQVLEALLLDDVQIAAPSVSKFTIYTKGLQVFDLPFLFQDMAAVDRFQHGPEGQALLTSFTDRGLLGLGYLHNGLKQMSATKKLVEPGDAAGLKFRIQTSDVLKAQFEALGAEAVAKPFSQVFTLLSTGVVDGQENSWSNIWSKKFYTVQPYITESNHGVIDYMVVTSMNFWEGLSKEDQKELKEILDESIAYGNEMANQVVSADRQRVIDSKQTEVVQLTGDQHSAWVQAMRPVWKRFEGDIGADLIEKAYKSNK